MKSKVLKAFDYSFDGIKASKAAVGDEIDFRDMTAGLAAEGYVATGDTPEPAAEPVTEVVTEPAADAEPEPTPEPAAEPAKSRKRR